MRRVLAVVCLLIVLGSSPRSLPAAQAGEPPSRDVLDSVVELILSGDADLLPVALEKVRGGLKGEDFTRELAEVVLPGLERSQEKAALLAALADRGDKAALPAMMAVAQGPADALVRAAAIRGVAALGGPAEVPFLESLLSGEAGTVDAARGALVAIRSDIVSPRLVTALGDKARPGPQRLAIVGILSAVALPQFLGARNAAAAGAAVGEALGIAKECATIAASDIGAPPASAGSTTVGCGSTGGTVTGTWAVGTGVTGVKCLDKVAADGNKTATITITDAGALSCLFS
jgi:type IV pilus assembly protein PilA